MKRIEIPFTFKLPVRNSEHERYYNYVQRKLSSLSRLFNDQDAYYKLLTEYDPVVYEVYEVKRPEVPGELSVGVSIIHPGKVGKEYFMTRGHFHTVLDTAEVYYCLKGEGYLVMETPEGDTEEEKLNPGQFLYVPPRWAHRAVCTSTEDFVLLFIYPAQAGHDYETIEKKGFRKLVIGGENGVKIIENPKWRQ
jgi:glucose-6-phosphate isomerase